VVSVCVDGREGIVLMVVFSVTAVEVMMALMAEAQVDNGCHLMCMAGGVAVKEGFDV